MCVTSCTTRSSIQSVHQPIPDSGSGGEAHRTTAGRSRNGNAIPFDVACGSPIKTSIGCPGRQPTASVTRSWMLSIAAAAWRAHGSNGAGKWTRKWAVSIVRHGADGACAGSAEHAIRSTADRANARFFMAGRPEV